MKNLHYLLLGIAVTTFSIYSAADIRPKFEDIYIKLVAKSSLCGGVNIRPKVANTFGGTAELRLRSVLFWQPLIGNTWNSEQIGSSGRLPPEGLRLRYDWGGPRPSFHYRVYCQKYTAVGGGQYNVEDVRCSDVVDIDGIKHNVGCVGGPAGPEASYSPLNMNKG